MRFFLGPKSMSISTLRLGIALASTVTLMACGKGPGQSNGSSQVAATVNGREISIHQIQTVVELQPKLAQQFGAEVSEKVLDSLIEQELAAQAAQSAGLDQSPKVVQALALSEREVLARAYQDQLAAKVAMPDDVDVEQYYKSHPELFEERRLFQLQEAVVRASSAELDSFPGQVESSISVAALNNLLQKSGLSYTARHSSQWAESLPMELLGRLSKLKAGQSIWIARHDGGTVITVVNAEVVPMSLGQAKPVIREALWTMRRKEAIMKGMVALREQAKVTRAEASPATAPAKKQP